MYTKAGDEDCAAIPRYGNIEIADDGERTRWAKAFGVSDAVLLQAVGIVGTSIPELRKLFCRD